MSSREEFETAVIERFKALGCLPVEIRTDLLQRSGDDYESGSVSAYWHFWQASRQALVIDLPAPLPSEKPYACYEGGWNDMRGEAVDAIEAAGVTVKP